MFMSIIMVPLQWYERLLRLFTDIKLAECFDELYFQFYTLLI